MTFRPSLRTEVIVPPRGTGHAPRPRRRLASRPAGFLGTTSSAWTLALCGLLLVWCTPHAGQIAVAADGAGKPVEVRRIALPADEIGRSSLGDRVPMSLSEFESLISASKGTPAGPAGATLTESTYTANCVDDTLRDGRLQIKVRRSAAAAVSLALQPLSFALHDLAWPERAAVWGRSPAGRTELLVDRAVGELSGEWELRGRRLSRAVQFDFRAPAASVTKLEIKLPADRLLTCSGGFTPRPEPAAEMGWNVWKILLGSRAECQLTVTAAGRDASAAGLALVRQEFVYGVRQEGVRLQADFNLEVLQTPLEQVQFVLDPDLEIYFVGYGTDVALPWKVADEAGERRLTVNLIDPLIGQGRPLRLRGLAAIKADSEWVLPRVRLRNAALSEGQLSLRVQSPLELKSFALQGYRQSSVEAVSAEDETLSFRQFDADGTVAVVLGDPSLRVSARVSTEVQTGRENWTSTSRIEWQARAGRDFMLRCRIPRDWEVTDVQAQTLQDIMSWNVQPLSEGRRELIVNLAESLSPDRAKRIDITARRLPVPPDLGVAIPAFEPVGVDDLDMLVGIVADASVRPVLEPGTTFDSVAHDALPAEWQGDDFWTARLAQHGAALLLLRLTDPVADGNFYLQSLQTPVDVEADVIADLGAERITETLSLQVTPQRGRTDRVLVYVNEAGPPLVWELPDPVRQIPLDAKKLPVGRHAAWDLPPHGELWEVRLPSPQSTPFAITAARRRGVPKKGRVALAFVPYANQFRGRVQVRLDADLEAGLQPFDLQPRVAERPEIADPALDTSAASQSWSYTGLTALLDFSISDDPASAPPAAIERLRLSSQLFRGPSLPDLHVATFHLGPSFTSSEFQWRLPATASLLKVQVDGQRVTPQRTHEEFRVAGLSVAAGHVVEIQYQHASTTEHSLWKRTPAAPQVDLPLLRFEWNIALAPGLQLTGIAPPLQLVGDLPAFSWRQRVFGPLGRDGNTPLFQHRRLAAQNEPAVPPAAEGDSTIRPRSHLPADGVGWEVWTATATGLPRLEVDVQDVRQARLMGWIAILATLTFGTALRVRRVPARGLIAVAFVAASALLAEALPPSFAVLAGGCLTGTLLAVMLPRVLLFRPPAPAQAAASVPPGSTQSFHHALLLGCACAGLIGTTVLCAQEPATPAVTPTLPPALERQLADPASVVIPVDKAGQPDGPKPLVYISPALAEKLRVVASRDRAVLPAYLISSAAYTGSIDSQQGILLRARYEIQVLSTSDKVAVELPLTNVNLGGSEPCLVDGQPHPVLTSPAIKGVLIELPGLAEGTTEDPHAGTAADAGVPHSRRAVIELHLYPAVTQVGDASRVQMGIPVVADSRLELAVEGELRNVEIPDTLGGVITTNKGLPITARLGELAELRLLWNRTSSPTAVVPLVEASAACLVDVQPTLMQFRYRIACHVREGPIGALSWRLPDGVALRSVSAPDLLSSALRSTAGETTLEIDFSRPHTDDFTVFIDFALANPSGPERLEVPPLRLGDAAGGAAQTVLVSQQVALRSSSEFQISPPQDVGERALPLSVEGFLEVWGTEAARPQLAYRVLDPASLSFGIHPLAAKRIVRLNRVLAWVGDRRMNWSLDATVEVQTAATFQHRLRFDPRLSITSVAVQEDAANRLLRWTRSGDILTLFLRDKTTGTQTIRITGTIPLRVPQEVAFPTVQILDAAPVETELVIYQDGNLAVELPDEARLTRREPTALQRVGDGRGLLVGVFTVPADHHPPLLKLARNLPELHCESVTGLQSRDARWRITTSLLFRVRQGHGSQFLLRIPADLPQFEIEAGDARTPQEKDPDGSVRVTLLPNQPVRDTFTVTVTATLGRPPESSWRIPEITPLNASLGESFLVVADSELAEVAEPRISGLRPAELPADLLRELPAGEFDGPQVRTFRGIARPWQINLRRKLTTGGEAGVLVADSQLTIDDYSRVSGVTTWLLLPSNLDSLACELPPRVRVDAVLVDGQPARFLLPAPGQMHIPIHLPQLGHAVQVFWSGPAGSAWRIAGQRRVAIPRVTGLPIRKSLVSILPPAEYSLQAHAGLKTLDVAEVQLVRLEGLVRLAAIQSEAGLTLTGNPAWQGILQQALELASRLESPSHPNSRLLATQQARLKVLKGQLAEFAGEETTIAPGEMLEPPAVAVAPSWPAAAPGPGLQGELRPASVTPEFWYLHHWLRDGVPAGLVFIGICLVGANLVRRGFGNWMAAHPAGAWLLLALVWWLWLAPSAAALAFVAAAAVSGIRAWRRRRRARSADEALDFVVA